MDPRWDRLFADLENSLAGSLDEDEIPELVEAERVSVRLADRLAAAVGRGVDLETAAGARVTGSIREAAADWLAVDAGPALHLVPLRSVRWLAAPEGPAGPSGGASRSSLAALLRRVARSSLPVVVGMDGISLRGHLTGVGADHFDLRAENGALRTIPLAAIDTVRCEAVALGADQER